ncbi:hypothetical protein ESCNG_30134 [Neisseria gonorrhoeae]|uniref:Uncharacterized protein n=1 Tax=Neisseria gonorrhoeae TaxID=485 RepID=A0AB74EMR9_NEIGO|nr:hypothetical protein ESCNG_110039 [Neisseria gonorrhoeae]SCW12335.1 hypothetical protein ESCNG_180029 [Neisseria gonorrhoeae]SCW14395.1 hypothetical protein ESCNG_30134 [Neisseria gonorrhoeae]
MDLLRIRIMYITNLSRSQPTTMLKWFEIHYLSWYI